MQNERERVLMYTCLLNMIMYNLPNAPVLQNQQLGIPDTVSISVSRNLFNLVINVVKPLNEKDRFWTQIRKETR